MRLLLTWNGAGDLIEKPWEDDADKYKDKYPESQRQGQGISGQAGAFGY